MAADDVENGTGSKDRKTVTLVASMVEGVSKQVESLDRLMQSEFKDVQRQLDSVARLLEQVNVLDERVKALSEKVHAHDKRFATLADDEKRKREYRIGPLVANLVGFAGVCVAVLAVLVSHA